MLGGFDVSGSGGNPLTSASGSGGDAGGGGGTAGAGGTAPIVYECAWSEPTPTVIQSYPAGGKGVLRDVFVAERGTSGKARVITLVREAIQDKLVVYDADASSTPFEFPGVAEVLHVARLSTVATGVLAVLKSGADYRLVMLELPDGANTLVERLLVAPANWSVYSKAPGFSGRFTPVDLLSATWSADVVVAFKATSTARSARYGNFTAKGGKMVEFVDPKLVQFSNGMSVTSVFRVKATNTTFAFIDPDSASEATSEFTLNAAVSGFVPPRSLGLDVRVDEVLPRKDGFNVLMTAIDGGTATRSVFAAQLPYARAGKFDPTEVPSFGSYSLLTQSDAPFGDPAGGWFGDVLGFVGGKQNIAADPSDEIRLLFFDLQGREIVKGTLPSSVAPPPSGFKHLTLGDFAVGLPGGVFNPESPTFHVAWSDVSNAATAIHVDLGFSTVICKPGAAP